MTFDEFLQEACPPLDLVWRKYRRRSARHRVDRRVRELGLDGYAAYLLFLHADPEEAARLADLMRVTVSRFFRERDRWGELAETVLPSLLHTTDGPTVRAWSVGCCGGEEPYTLSLLWLGLSGGRTRDRTLDVVATDIDPAALERAGRAVYATSSLREVPLDVRDRWFVAHGAGQWGLASRVTAPVRFRLHHFIEEPPPATCDLVLCRYLAFTYYQGDRRSAAVRRLAAGVRPGGALMIGAKEALLAAEGRFFSPWPGTRGVYRRTQALPGRGVPLGGSSH